MISMRGNAIFAIIALLWATAAPAVTVSRIYDFQPDTPAEADKVDAEFDNIISALDGNLSSVNIAAGGIATANLATASVTTTKMGAQNRTVSTSSGVAQRDATTDSVVPNLTGSITVISRPVFVGLQAIGGLSAPGRISYRHNGGGATDNSAYVSFRRVGLTGSLATVNQTSVGARSITSSADDILEQLPCSSYWFIDNPGAGPYTYEADFRIATADSGIITVENCQLVLFEL